MQILILTSGDFGNLQNLNQSSSNDYAQITAIPYSTGFFLNASLLTDCGPNQTWSYYGDFLKSLLVQNIDISLLINTGSN